MRKEVKLVQNERSWTISLISFINFFLSNKTLKIKKSDGERTINTGTQRMFPDILMYGDIDKQMLLQGWEIKMPDVSINDSDFYEDAKRKAINLNLNSFFLWNFSFGKLFIKQDNNFIEDKSWDLSSIIKNRADVEIHEKSWKKTIEDILFYVNLKFENRTLSSASLGDIISTKVMSDIINRNKSITGENLKNKSLDDGIMRSNLDLWWRDVKEEYLKEENDAYKAYSRMIILGWLNRILFAHVIKKYHSPAAIVENIDYETTIPDTIEIFKYITKECDFYNVFNIYNYSEFIAEETWVDLIEFNLFLKDSNIDKIESESFHNILENSVVSAKREVLGQFTTPEKLATLLLGITINKLRGHFIDPCCGTGTIAIKALNLKRKHLDINKALETTWSSDKQSFPLQIASVGFTNSEAINTPSLIFQKNVFTLKQGDIINIINPIDGSNLNFEIPKFDTIASNLPFVSSNRDREDLITEIIERVSNDTGIKLSARNDLYTYIMFKLWDNLNDEGRLGVITSNSWFGTDAGKQFFDAIQFYYKVIGIHISDNGKWFQNASVRTTILILERKEISQPNNDDLISFGKINKKLMDISNRELEIIKNSIVIGKETDSNLVSITNYSNLEVNNILKMNVSLNAIFHNTKWLPMISDKLTNLTEYYKVYRGGKTGKDEIFLLNNEVDVDKEYIIMGLKNARRVDTLIATPDTRVLSCNLTMSDLKKKGKIKTYNWFHNFKNNLTVTLRNKGDRWNILDTSKVSDLFTMMNPDERIFFGRFETPTYINQRLIGLSKIDSSVDNLLIHALLNSLIGMFYIEAIGFGRGEGALDFSKDNLEKIKLLNPDILDSSARKKILDAFEPLLNRKILKLEDELIDKDRINFEKVILESYGLLEYYEIIKNSLLSLQRNRLSVNI